MYLLEFYYDDTYEQKYFDFISLLNFLDKCKSIYSGKFIILNIYDFDSHCNIFNFFDNYKFSFKE